jgi:dimethylamine--corrinoid protein Co-methyltransferase
MGGTRTTGDMVMRVQLAKKLRIDAAKAYVAEKLDLRVEDICDVITMTEIRADRGFGLPHVEPYADSNIGMEAKFKIAKALDIRINSVEKFKELAGID